MRDYIKNENGITLVSLVITIIVIIILSGVALSLTIGEDGIIEKAITATKINEEVATKEEIQIEALACYDSNGVYSSEIAKKRFKKDLGIDINEYEPECFEGEYKGIYFEISKNGIVNFERSYIQNGLILRYDGIQNSRNGNNPQATIWEDLSGNGNDGIFANSNNSITYKENGYEFTNNDDYIISTNKLNLSSDPDVTFEFVYEWYGFQSNQNTGGGLFWIGSSTDLEGKSFACHIFKNPSKLSFNTVNTRVARNGYLPTINKKYNISLVKKAGDFNEENASLYENMEKISDNCYIYHERNTMDFEETPIQIGRAWQWNNQNRTLNGIIYEVRVYNRALNEDEIKHNYEVDRRRFEME